MGQWKHPGENTRIPGGNITMQGVSYPVLAQPNVGQPQMMYPGMEYQFPGADYVDEYPQMAKMAVGGPKPRPRRSTSGEPALQPKYDFNRLNDYNTIQIYNRNANQVSTLNEILDLKEKN
jgi:hypothetical protein